MIAAEDPKQRMSDVTRKVLDVRVPRSELSRISSDEFTHTIRLMVTPGTWEVGVAVVDRTTGTAGYVTRKVDVAG
jgi:hypothetical protein